MMFAVSAFYIFSAVFLARADNVTTTVTVSNGDPTVSGVDLNAGTAISLTEATTTVVNCAATITDINGGSDISSATGTVYRSGVSGGGSCTAGNENCYQIATSSCSLGTVSGNDRPATCTVNVWFYADPTDAGAYSAQTWQCQITGKDASSGVGSGTDSTPPELNGLSALDVSASIAYGSLAASTTPANVTVTTTVTSTGNVSIDTYLAGANMTSGGNTIGVGNERYATSSAAWASAVALTASNVLLDLNMVKPSANPSNSASSVYWGISIPSGQVSGAYSGAVTSTAVAS